ncbi:MAG TPA: hypothetical protein VNK91_06525 [Burkholderiaceae bacterium]|nr:hypothetical protein [Burkholderiaceae bacterium]
MTVKAVIEKITFTAGEVSPTLRAAIDLKRYQAGLAHCDNMTVLYEGALSRSPGTRFVAEVKNESEPSAAIPFRYTTGDYYMLAINGGKARVLRDGGVVMDGGNPFEFTVPWSAADLEKLRYSQTATSITVVCPGYQPRVLTRSSHTNWNVTLYQSKKGPFDVQNLDQSKTLQASAVTGTVALTAAGHAPFSSDDIGTLWRLDEKDLSAVPYWRASVNVAQGDQRRFQGRVYEALNAGDSGPTAPTHEEGDWNSGAVTWRFLHKGYGLVRITAITNSQQATGTVEARLPDSVVAGPTWRWWPPAWSGVRGWPDAIWQYEGRLMFGRDDLFWGSVPNAHDDHEQKVEDDGVAADDSAIAFRLRSPSGARPKIEWGLASHVQVLGARDCEWVVRPRNATQALSPANIRADEEDDEGSAPHIAARVAGGGIFIGRSRKRLHYVKFDPLTEKLMPEELTATARHILEGEAAWLAWQRDPNRVLWVGCLNGDLMGMTFMPKEQVIGWHRRTLKNGYVERVAGIGAADDAFSEIYLWVRRTINGQTRRYIEYLMNWYPTAKPLERTTSEGAAAWFLDCAIEYSGPPTSTISGLSHLKGEEVGIFADGAMHPRRTVSQTGSITLERPVSHALIGIPQSWYVQTLPIEPLQPGGGSRRDQAKRASRVILHLLNSAGGWIRVNGSEKEALFHTGAADYGAAQKLFTGALDVAVAAGPEKELVVEIGGEDALPFTLLGITVSSHIEDED